MNDPTPQTRRVPGPSSGFVNRVFSKGELRLVLLALVAERERHGYDIIKELSKRVGGDYKASPGVVYPTLTMLVSLGYATVRTEIAGRKLYIVTPHGERVVAENRAQINQILARFSGSSAIERSTLNLSTTIHTRLRSGATNTHELQAIVDAIDAVSRKIEQI
jgi:DNA-binding PadR family transcriptional regulator